MWTAMLLKTTNAGEFMVHVIE